MYQYIINYLWRWIWRVALFFELPSHISLSCWVYLKGYLHFLSPIELLYPSMLLHIQLFGQVYGSLIYVQSHVYTAFNWYAPEWRRYIWLYKTSSKYLLQWKWAHHAPQCVCQLSLLRSTLKSCIESQEPGVQLKD